MYHTSVTLLDVIQLYTVTTDFVQEGGVYETSVLSGYYNRLFRQSWISQHLQQSCLPFHVYVLSFCYTLLCGVQEKNKCWDDLSVCLHTFLYIAFAKSRSAGWILIKFYMNWRLPKIHTLHLIVVFNSDMASVSTCQVRETLTLLPEFSICNNHNKAEIVVAGRSSQNAKIHKMLMKCCEVSAVCAFPFFLR